MTLDIVLLIATILVAIAAVIVSMLQAARERRRSRRSWAQPGPGEVADARLGRAVPPPIVHAGFEASPPMAGEPRPPVPVMDPALQSAPTPDRAYAPLPVVADVEAAAAPPVVAASAAPLSRRKRRAAAAAAAAAAMPTATAPPGWPDGQPAVPEVTDPELAYRIGVPGVPRPSRPAVLVVADGEQHTVLPSPVATEAWPKMPHRRRRAAFRVAAAATALAAVMTAAIVLPDLGQQSGVLSETGRPASGAPGAIVETPEPSSAPTPKPTPAPTAKPTPAPTAVPTPAATPTPSAASTGSVVAAATTPRPPAATPRPRAATPRPPAATPTPTPTPKPTAKPTPKPTAPPPPPPPPDPKPIAFFDCTVVILTISCDGSASDHADSYAWNFGDGGTAGGAKPPPHLYLAAGCYDVRLTVSNPSGTDSDLQTYLVAVGNCGS